MLTPEIAATVREEGASIEDLKIDVIKDYWVDFEKDGVKMGVAQFSQKFANCYEGHIQVLPEYRKKYTQEIGVKLWGWVEENLPGSLIVTHVPFLYDNVKNFLLVNGFKQVGILEKAYRKEGKQNDMWILTKRAK